MTKQHEADARFVASARRRLERIKDAMRFTALGFLISLVFLAWTAVFWVPVFYRT